MQRRLLFAAFALPLLHTKTARAHAVLVAADPAHRSRVPLGPRAIALTFNTRIDHARSRLELVDPAAVATTLDLLPAEPSKLRGAATIGVAGAWRLRWQVLAADGHITRGEVQFEAGMA